MCSLNKVHKINAQEEGHVWLFIYFISKHFQQNVMEFGIWYSGSLWSVCIMFTPTEFHLTVHIH
jgi:hypothetical protein